MKGLCERRSVWRLSGTRGPALECCLSLTTAGSVFFLNLRQFYLFLGRGKLFRGKKEEKRKAFLLIMDHDGLEGVLCANSLQQPNLDLDL